MWSCKASFICSVSMCSPPVNILIEHRYTRMQWTVRVAGAARKVSWTKMFLFCYSALSVCCHVLLELKNISHAFRLQYLSSWVTCLVQHAVHV